MYLSSRLGTEGIYFHAIFFGSFSDDDSWLLERFVVCHYKCINYCNHIWRRQRKAVERVEEDEVCTMMVVVVVWLWCSCWWCNCWWRQWWCHGGHCNSCQFSVSSC